jgi:glycosyltransferase involved in cell wall biosynthesis
MQATRASRNEVRHLLHVFASFGLGGVPIRICDVVNALPEKFHHTIIALDACFDARRRLAPQVRAEFRKVTLPKYCVPCSMMRIRNVIRDVGADLLLTYNWGSIEFAMANRLFGVCDHIHFESGFGSEESNGQLWRRVAFRRLALAKVQTLVVPSRTLMEIAGQTWRIPRQKLVHIPNGVDVSRFSGQPGKRDESLPIGTARYRTVIGTVAPLRPEKNVARLLRAFSAIPVHQDCGLVVAGDGAELPRLRALAKALKIDHRVHFLGHVDDVPAIIRGIDVFALSSDTEQMPNSLLQAMAAGRPVAAVDVGDVRDIVSHENRPFVVPRDDERALTMALAMLISDPQRCSALGRSNQEHIKANYNVDSMIAAYRSLLDPA